MWHPVQPAINMSRRSHGRPVGAGTEPPPAVPVEPPEVVEVVDAPELEPAPPEVELVAVELAASPTDPEQPARKNSIGTQKEYREIGIMS